MAEKTQGCWREEEEADQFFDSREELSCHHGSCQEENSVYLFTGYPHYEVWIKSPGSIHQRRSLFRRWMDLDHVDSDGELMVDHDSIAVDLDRLSFDSDAVINSSDRLSWSDEVPSTSEDRSSDVQFEYRIKNLDDGRVFVAGESSHDGTVISFREVGSNQMVSISEFERSFGSSSFVQQLMRSDGLSSSSNQVRTPRRRRTGWLKRLGAVACIADRRGHEFHSDTSNSNDLSKGARFERVMAHPCRKQSKEFSAVYRGQNFAAHRGAILAMKFNPNGEYLASGGEDGVVKVWQVMECRRTNVDDIPADDPSCIYFDVSHNSELIPLHVDKKTIINSKCLRSDSACIVFPPKIFQISEKPLYEFNGHHGDVLDLAWSKDQYLLSSSVDKTVRLWQLGFDRCLKVFPHNNYVTCIQFNPIDERYFISGSIDGKARIWEISACRVVDWIDVSQIITAVCYRPDGKVVAVGSMMGDCRFYDASENHLQLETEVSFQGRKKSIDKRITGFQFCPINNQQLIVTSADSVVRLLDGVDVVSKYKGIRNAGSRISAMFTLDGRHIVSASEDSNVYVWNRLTQNHTFSSNHVKSTRACERFESSHVSVAIPWHGYQSKKVQWGSIPELFSTCEDHIENLTCSVNSLSCDSLHPSPSSSFTRRHEFFSEVHPKGSATWPEEKLPSSMSSSSNLRKSQLKFLKTCCQKNTSHAWGQVIVTAGLDGRIRLFQNFGLPVHL